MRGAEAADKAWRAIQLLEQARFHLGDLARLLILREHLLDRKGLSACGDLASQINEAVPALCEQSGCDHLQALKGDHLRYEPGRQSRDRIERPANQGADEP